MGRKRPRGERVAFDISLDATNALAHARMVPVPVVRARTRLCAKCPIKKRAGYPGPNGRTNQLCAAHAKEAGTHTVLYPCTECPIGSKVNVKYNGANGRMNQLCSAHAREAGTYTVQHPCTQCPVEAKVTANYKGVNGRMEQLCGPHARAAGTYEPQKSAQCANCQDNARYRFSADSKFAGEHACLPSG